mmetsp:Transcript_45307/g.92431  ORF Transcript_45307/g.92431 Transcript_45307/m.92431 type:complete len:200 (-) Transcript_45307:23-622(-)
MPIWLPSEVPLLTAAALGELGAIEGLVMSNVTTGAFPRGLLLRFSPRSFASSSRTCAAIFSSRATASGALLDKAVESVAAMSRHHNQPPVSAMKTKESPGATPPISACTASLAARKASAAADSPSIRAFGAVLGSLGISAKRFATISSASPSVSLPLNSSGSSSFSRYFAAVTPLVDVWVRKVEELSCAACFNLAWAAL